MFRQCSLKKKSTKFFQSQNLENPPLAHIFLCIPSFCLFLSQHAELTVKLTPGPLEEIKGIALPFLHHVTQQAISSSPPPAPCLSLLAHSCFLRGYASLQFLDSLEYGVISEVRCQDTLEFQGQNYLQSYHQEGLQLPSGASRKVYHLTASGIRMIKCLGTK